MRNAGKVSSEEVSRRPPAGAILLRASARGEPLAAASGRSVTFVASDPSVGRDMHTIQPGAWQAANFLRNPVFLWSHRADEPPIGRVTNLYTTARARLMAAVEYAERDAYPFADTIDQLVKQGFLSAVSTGWIPLEWKAARDRSQPGGLDFTLVELLELSQVPVPALPTALAAGRAAGVDITPFAAWAERALDRPRPAEGRTAITREDLVMIRNAAGAAKVYAAPRHSPFERSARRRRRLRQLRPFSSGGRARSVAGDKRSSPDPRAQTGAAFETDPTAGGFLVPTTYVESLVASMYDEAVIAPLCDRMETDKPATAVLPGIDETSRADGSRWGGATAYWSVEAPNVCAFYAEISRGRVRRSQALCRLFRQRRVDCGRADARRLHDARVRGRNELQIGPGDRQRPGLRPTARRPLFAGPDHRREGHQPGGGDDQLQQRRKHVGGPAGPVPPARRVADP